MKLKKILTFLMVIVMALGIMTATAMGEIVLEMPQREDVQYIVDLVTQEYNIIPLLEQFGFGLDDFVQYMYRGATDIEIMLAFLLEFGENWLVVMTEESARDILAAYAEHGADLTATVLTGIFEWAWDPRANWSEISAIVEAEHLGERFELNATNNSFGVIFSELTGANLNLFVKNNGDQYITFAFHVLHVTQDYLVPQPFYFWDEELMYKIAEIPPGRYFVIQLPPSVIDQSFVSYELFGVDTPQITADFGFRYTLLPLGYE
ncbi:MAG: hypothetical protein FWB74_01130 [Defluviitaleaceae bacterium]|nr:hypothetical protein [Defluviitaleaceae bacterium]